jgi:hypothetical protein
MANKTMPGLQSCLGMRVMRETGQLMMHRASFRIEEKIKKGRKKKY